MAVCYGDFCCLDFVKSVNISCLFISKMRIRGKKEENKKSKKKSEKEKKKKKNQKE